MYDYEGLLLLLEQMVWLAQCDVRRARGMDNYSAYLFLYWAKVELVPYLEDVKGE